MALICKIPVVWNGQQGLPGVSIFYCDAAVSTAVAALVTFFNAIKTSFPNALSWVVPGAGDVIETDHGALAGTWTMSGSGTVTGTGGAVAYAAGTGARLKFLTNGIVHGRRVRGSVFLTGMSSSLYDTNGTIANGTIGAFQTAGGGLVSDGSFRVYRREYKFDEAHPDIPARLGSAYAYTACVGPDQVTSLRSRRV